MITYMRFRPQKTRIASWGVPISQQRKCLTHTEGPAWFVMCNMCNDDWNIDFRRSEKMSPHKGGPHKKKFGSMWHYVVAGLHNKIAELTSRGPKLSSTSHWSNYPKKKSGKFSEALERLFLGTFQDQLKWLTFLWELKISTGWILRTGYWILSMLLGLMSTGLYIVGSRGASQLGGIF